MGAKSTKHWIWTFTGKFVSSRALSRAADRCPPSSILNLFVLLSFLELGRQPTRGIYIWLLEVEY